MRRAPLVAVIAAACAAAVPAVSLAGAPALPVCSTNPETGGTTRCATVRPPGAWAKAAAYRATGYALPRPRNAAVLRPMALTSIRITKPDRVDEGECGTQAEVDAQYRGGGKTLSYRYVENDCGEFQRPRPGEEAVTVPGATAAIAMRSGGANVVAWTRSDRAAIDGAYMIGIMTLRSSTLPRARLLEIAGTIR